MNAVGLLPLATGAFAMVGAVVCFRQAADPMAMLQRQKNRTGVDYTRMISDPQKFSERAARQRTFSGVFLCVIGLPLVVVGCFALAMPSVEEDRVRNARVQQEMRKTDDQMQ